MPASSPPSLRQRIRAQLTTYAIPPAAVDIARGLDGNVSPADVLDELLNMKLDGEVISLKSKSPRKRGVLVWELKS